MRRGLNFFLILFLVVVCLGVSAQNQIRFERINENDGLSHHRITSIFQDELGFMWFATQSGLNRYDGNEIKVLQSGDENPGALSNANLRWIKEGPDHQLWIKATYGVFIYDIYTEKFVDKSELLRKLEVSNHRLREIIEDDHGNFWFLMDNVGLKVLYKNGSIKTIVEGDRLVTSMQLDDEGLKLVFADGNLEIINTQKQATELVMPLPEKIRKYSDLHFIIDQDGDYWFYSEKSLIGAIYCKKDFQEIRFYGKKEIGSDAVVNIAEEPDGTILLCVDHLGLVTIEKEDWEVQIYMHNPADPKSIGNDLLVCVYVDRNGLVWIGTHKGGISYYSSNPKSFDFYKFFSENSNEGDILHLSQDSEGKLWAGTDGGGLLYLDDKTKELKKFVSSDQDALDDIITCIKPDGKGGMWLGTYLEGLKYYDGKRFYNYPHDENDPNSPSGASIWTLQIDSRGNLWVGGLNSGVDVYNADFQKILHMEESNNRVMSNHVTVIQEDQEGKIWIGSGYGVTVFDWETRASKHMLNDPEDDNTLSNNSIMDLLYDKSGNMWVGTMYGLNRVSKNGEIKRWTKTDGLAQGIISSIEQDNEGTLWIGTYKGIAKMIDAGNDTFHFENYGVTDGLQGELFNFRSSTLLSDGRIAFGGKNGLNLFNPEEVYLDSIKPPLRLLDFQIFNTRIASGDEFNDRIWFEEGLSKTESIILEPYENTITIGFVALDFFNQKNLEYQYRMVGFDSKWISYQDTYRASFTNLDPGSYQFEVMAIAKNNPKNASMETLDIKIELPFWRTPMAIILYGITFVISMVFTRNFILRKERYRAKVERDQLEAQRMHELDNMKIRFFTNVSHEFRTPLTLIITPLTRLLKKHAGQSDEKQLQMVFRNAKRLLTLVNQLLDLRKMEVGEHRLSLAAGDLIAFIKHTMEHFSDLSSEKRINLELKSELQSHLVYFDRDKMEKVLFNLLSNAFKFTSEGGKILIWVEEKENSDKQSKVKLIVEDTGRGMDKEQSENVFKRFYQLEGHEMEKNTGSGIGLSITKDFVEMHEGTIYVESEIGNGSRFIINLPLKKFSLDTIDSEENEMDSDVIAENPNLPTILIAEDNSEFRRYLVDSLSEYFNVSEAINGKEAWKKTMQAQPDLIVTDILMPEMDGVSLCNKVKKDPRTSHIPVVMLTSLYSDEQKVNAFDSGASEYITKPFNFEVLLKSLQSLIHHQESVHKLEQRVEVAPKEIEIVPLDQQLISNAVEIVEKNISNANFSVQELSSELAVSRGQLYKKTVEITGKTPIEFIRSIRLKRAAALLEKSQMTVAEVAYSVGFNNPKYFAKYFRTEYNVLPSKFAANQVEEIAEDTK